MGLDMLQEKKEATLAGFRLMHNGMARLETRKHRFDAD
jgi:hypothetical protein